MRRSGNGMWGHGVYLAVNASYSKNYSFSCPNGHKQFFLISALLGDTIELKPDSSLRTPPSKSSAVATHDEYDSVKGFTAGSDVYILYSQAATYPRYLIEYSTE
jgi:hypothetical protein